MARLHLCPDGMKKKRTRNTSPWPDSSECEAPRLTRHHSKQHLFSDAKAGKERIKEIFGVRLADDFAYRLGSEAKCVGGKDRI